MFEKDQKVKHPVFGSGVIKYIGPIEVDKNDRRRYINFVISSGTLGSRKIRYFPDESRQMLTPAGAAQAPVAEPPQAKEVAEPPQAKTCLDINWIGPKYGQFWPNQIRNWEERLTVIMKEKVNHHLAEFERFADEGKMYLPFQDWKEVVVYIEDSLLGSTIAWQRRMGDQCMVMVNLLSDDDGHYAHNFDLKEKTIFVMCSVLEYLHDMDDEIKDWDLGSGFVDDAKMLDIGLAKIRTINKDIICK